MASYRESTIVHIACDPPALLWGGFGLLAVPADHVIAEDTYALGGGELVDVPDFQQLIGNTAERLDITVSGVTHEITRLAVEDAPSVRGARVDVGIVHFDLNWQVTSIEWEQVFEARSLSVSRGQMGEDGQVSRTITLTIVQGSTTRSRAKFSYFTDADQKRRSADDQIFSNVATISEGTTRRFGPKD